MTGLLKDLMHERAASLDAPEIDLAAVTAAGSRRVRQRRTAWAGTAAAATLVAASVGGWLVAGEGARDRDGTVADGTGSAPVALSWVTGQTLHRAGSSDVDLGHPVRSWVWADGAVAFVDRELTVRLWDGGESVAVGTLAPVESDNDARELVADGPRVAWVDAEGVLTAHDLTTGDTERTPVVGRAQVTALDRDTVYAVDERGVLAWDLEHEITKVIDPDPSHLVLDAESGTAVKATGDRRARVTGPGRRVSLTVDGFANLSPDGTLVMAESDDEGVILDTRTGERVRLDDGHDWALPFQWLDDDTVAVLAFDGVDTAASDESAHLLRCTVATGSCDEPAEELPSELGSFQLPVGITFTE